MEKKLARTKCNNCGADSDITQLEVYFGEDEASETLQCDDCETIWTNVYVFDREEE